MYNKNAPSLLKRKEKGTASEMIKSGYTVWNVPSQCYAIFDCFGNDARCIKETWERFYKEFLPQMGYEAADATDLEVYPENAKDGLFCELWIPINKK